jgi:hypothetical protein
MPALGMKISVELEWKNTNVHALTHLQLNREIQEIPLEWVSWFLGGMSNAYVIG